MANLCYTGLVLAAASASVNGSDLDNLSARGATVVVNITAITGTTPSLTVTVEGKDPLSGKYFTLLASAALTATGTTVLSIGPALTAAANSVANAFVPPIFRIRATIAGTTPAVTATVGVCLNG